MAKLFSYAIFLLLLLSTISLLFSFSSAKVICEKLPKEVCSFAISSTSNRCILESSSNQLIGEIEYQCKTSDVMVQRISDYIENDQCVQSCGVERNTVGISSDSLLDSRFTSKICSASCYQNCPNIVDLYFNLAAGEGVFLPKLCEENIMNPHRAMTELLSSGDALAPESSSAPESSIEAQSPEIVKLGSTMSPARKLLSLLDAEAPESFGEDLAPAPSPAVSPARSLLTSAEAPTPESSSEELGPAESSGEELGPAFEPLAPALSPARSLLTSAEAPTPEGSSEELGPAESSGEELGPAESSGEELGPAFEPTPARSLLTSAEAPTPEGSSEELGPVESSGEELGPVESSGEELGPAESSGEELDPAFEPLAPSTPLDFDLFNPPAPAPAPWPQ